MAAFTTISIHYLVVFLIFSQLFCLGLAISARKALSEDEKEAARSLFVLNDGGSYGSLKETFKAVRSLQALGGKGIDASKTCKWIAKTSAGSAGVEEVYYAIRSLEILKCKSLGGLAQEYSPILLNAVKENKSLLDVYYSVGALSRIQEKDRRLEDEIRHIMPTTLEFIKKLGQSDGTWRYVESKSESTAAAAGLALEAIAGIAKLFPDLIPEKISSMKIVVSNLLENLEGYGDGAYYFDVKEADQLSEATSAIASTAFVVRGLSALATTIPGIKIAADKVTGIANFLSSMGIAGASSEAFNQLDALSLLDHDSFVVPLFLSLERSSLSLAASEKLKVVVTTVLGSLPPPLKVTLLSAAQPTMKAWSHKVLTPVEGTPYYVFEFLSEKIALGKYDLKFEVQAVDTESSVLYTTGGPVSAFVTVTGHMDFSDVQLAIVDSDSGSSESIARFNPNDAQALSISANHLQKLQVSFDVTSKGGIPFEPQQVFFKLRHNSSVEHLFLIKPNKKQFKLSLDFLGLVEKFFYLSGQYTMELIVGDTRMDNPFHWTLGTLDLDLPDAPESAAKPPHVVRDVSSEFSPRPEIAHIFRAPEKRPSEIVSNTFFVLTLVPLAGFGFMLRSLNANLKGFPSSGGPLISACAFLILLAGILGLYVLFWWKLNLFTTLKLLGFLGIFTSIFGHLALSYVADSSKVKTS